MIYYTIYKITNNINGKYYIGKHQTFDLNDGYMGSGKLLKLAINKYGIENFTKEVLHIFKTEEEMNAKEKELVVISEQTYNLNEGGHGGFGYINSKGLNKENLKLGTKGFQKKLKDPEFYESWYEKVISAQKTESYRLKQSESSKKAHREGKCTHHQLNSPEAIKKKKETWKKNGHQKGENNNQYGTFWVTNGIESIRVKSEKEIPQGWYKGRKMKRSLL